MSLHIAIDDKAPVAKTVLMPGDPLRAQYIAENFLEDARMYSSIRNMYGFTGTYKGVPVSIQGSGMGMPSMGIYSWELMTAFDVQNIIRIGTAGTFSENIDLGDIVIGLAASTDSNYQHTFELNGTYSPSCSYDLLTKAQAAGRENDIDFTAGNIVSCDVFYEINEDWWKKWAHMGVLGVEMETAALYMNAAYLGRNALSMVTISDNFVTGGRSSVEDREHGFTKMMELALETAVKTYEE
ncbi:MAG: purine-nucleoside phosphorylase [Eubacteriales bacterium]|nr:purine-nucleoside phosphorylase [Eubacteriales bacterium]